VKVKLYGVPGSHPVKAAELMLDHKGIPYKRRDLFPVASRWLTRLLGFKGNRVPAMKIDGRRVQGTHDVARELEAVQPDPPLFPADPAQRGAVEEAEAWSDPFQQVPRGIIWWALKKEPGSQRSFLEDAKLGVPLPTGMLIKTSGPILWGAGRMNDSYDETVKAHIAEIPAALDRIDGWIAEGVLGGAQPNAADFQIAPSVRLLMTFDDLRPAIENRPAGQHAQRFLPEAPGHIPPVFPAEWLEPLRAGSPT
jgi:glutathione S-transferase